MYLWRKLNEKDRNELMRIRRLRSFPMHLPPHFESFNQTTYFLSAATYNHQKIIFKNFERIDKFCQQLCKTLTSLDSKLHAWCVLANHWHALVTCEKFKLLLKEIGKLHGKASFYWNKQDNCRGRQCWHGCSDRIIRSKRHFMVARNYIHKNPVKHGYVKDWIDWPYSSFPEFIKLYSSEIAELEYIQYPILNMGKSWDNFD